MFNRIRISTSLFLLLISFCIMQLISTGLSYVRYAPTTTILNVLPSVASTDALSLSWVSLLQARNTLNRAGTRGAEGAAGAGGSALMAAPAARCKKPISILTSSSTRLARMSRNSSWPMPRVIATRIYALRELIVFLENRNLQAFMDQPTQKIQDRFEADFVQYLQLAKATTDEASASSQQAYALVPIWLVAGAVLMLLVVTLSAMWWLRTMLVQPLNIIRGHFERIASGDLSAPIEVYGRNEISQLFASLQRMQQSLIGTVGAVRDGAESILIGLQEIAEGNNDLSSRTEQQDRSLEETAASMEQLTATVKQNADNARQASQLARDASSTAAKRTLADDVVTTMHDIANSSQKIGAITSVIDGIAFQTNILALNAAVEAARAGEQGRGFAVVAGEVRNLASRSAQAAKEIKLLIDESVSRVKHGSVLVENSGATMQDIVRSVTRVTDIMGEIASASDEQSRGIEQVTQALPRYQVTQQNAALVVESASAAAALEEQAITLADAVAVFRLADD
nr:tas [Klebsiella aerogenes]